eukprot:CAMPEP_0178391844 /NCGR_PEP_ID=MMETSP0689_2-20121128/11373_1 /TAXON_ID=160604 /ORGANISM="Amphidinium massartii, Strain CS-259" /LENGTH=393 /DNA_ID=CAMNT_0020012401 /DNA_START=166 /DNA_END=1347 /DNA_ORIENTATION=+
MKAYWMPIVSSNGRALAQVPEPLLSDRQLILAAVSQHGAALSYAPEDMRRDREVVLAAVTSSGAALRYADYSLCRDKEIVMAAVKQSRYALAYAGTRMRKDKQVILEAVRHFGTALEYADDSEDGPMYDKQIVLAAVKNTPSALEFASPPKESAPCNLQDDFDIVLAAVSQDGMMLKLASERLRNHRSIVLAAVQQQGLALEFASEECRADRELVEAAIRDTSEAMAYVDRDLQADGDLMRLALKSGVEALNWGDGSMLSQEHLEELVDGRRPAEGFIVRVYMKLTGRCCILHCAYDDMAEDVCEKSFRQLRPTHQRHEHMSLWLVSQKEKEARSHAEDTADLWFTSDSMPNKRYEICATQPVPEDVPLGEWPGVRSNRVNDFVLKLVWPSKE